MPGLGDGWTGGTIHASALTCRLVEKLKGVPASGLRAVEPGDSFELDGATVTVLPANHCPGSVMFHLRERRRGRTVLYTGDFRLDDEVRAALRGVSPVDAVYFDGTYADGGYSFPSQEEAVAEVVRIVSSARPGRRVMLAVYTLGKNRVVEAVARATGERVYMPDRFRRVYELLGMGDLVTGDRASTRLSGYARAYFDEYFFRSPLKARKDVLVVIPTGWAEDEPARPSWRGGAEFRYVPYSEHCDSAECREALSIIGARDVAMIGDAQGTE
jgi:hypothetical protein